MKPHKIVSQEEWLAARKALLESEKAHMREGDKLAAERRGFPRGSLPCAAPQDNGLQEAHGLALRMGVILR